MTQLPNFIELPAGILYKATCGNDFIAKIRQAHVENCDEYRKLRSKIATENTWDKRGEQLHRILKEALGDAIPDLDLDGERVSS